jgi:5-bromo-4-chloroindolyl phosphate hydrolysis protein
MKTRSDQKAVRDQAKRKKQKQCSTPEGKEKQREAEKRARRKRRIENEWRDEEVEILKRKLIKKHNKIVQLTHVLKEKENQISFLGKCLKMIKITKVC